MTATTAKGRGAWDVFQSRVMPGLLRGLDRLPWPVGEEIMGALAIARGLVDPPRVRQTLRWAGRLPIAPRIRWRIAIALLRNRGRFLAMDARLGLRDQRNLQDRTVLEGREHLDTATRQGGTLLLGFHLGPAIAADLGLRALGLDVTIAGAGPTFGDRPRARQVWVPFLDQDDRLVLWPDAASRTAGLYRVHRMLHEGRTVYQTADGPIGLEAFRIPLPGAPMVIRSGWLALRRRTRAAVLPVLGRRHGARVIVTLHPPLPPPDPDPVHDLAACREILGALVSEYVRRFPEQCLSLAFWPTDAVATAGQRDSRVEKSRLT